MIEGVWNSKYICQLGILDHAKEIQILYDQYRIAKLEDEDDLKHRRDYCLKSFDKECTDLFLILQKYLQDKNILKQERENKFREKEANELV